MVVNDHNNPGVGKTQRRRLFLLLACAGLWTGLLIGRLGQLQIVMHDELVERARERHQYVESLPATRGDIYAADGSLLASSIQGRAIYVYPHLLDDPESAAAALAPALQMPVEEVFPLVTQETRGLVYLRKFAPPEMVEKVLEVRRRLNLYTSLGSHEASARFYPNRQLGAHVLGFVDYDGNGAAGIEYALDKAIRGQDGQWITLKDGGQTPIDPDGIFREDPVPGHDVFLTLDPAIQRVAEATLERAVHEHDADGASAVVMDPRTGAVLALASYPTFNPNVRNEALVELSSANSVVNHAYEPGSTFKIFTAAAGLTEKVVYEDELIDCQGGALRVANHTYHDWRSGFGVMPFSQVIANSSNVGTIKVGLRISPEHFYRWLQGFGFGQPTGIELPGEAPGIVHEPGSSLWSGLSQSSMIIGQEIGVTPLQLTTAVSAIANGGLLMKPYLVSQIRDADGTLQMERRPEVRRRVLDQTVARRVLNVLEGVVRPDNNTGKAAGIPGYRIAGKTGTAQKIGPDGRYSQYMSSFVGILPASAPQLVVLVVIDAPRKGYYGTEVAAPAFRTIAETAVRVLRIAPDAVAAPVQINGS
ncbi:MAG: penicillin-binding protein 2 [Acidobacteriota bacterium]|jgi:cell division protein FtsI (penicillin-binding protein 3)